MRLKRLFYTLLLLISTNSYSATHYILDGGSGDGSAWDNALDDLPATLVRGDTYYMGDGTYSGYTFNDNASGSTLITIKKATAGDHGAETGWNATYGDGTASFSGQLTFDDPYYTIDGQTRNADEISGYGFYIDSTVNGRGILFNTDDADNITIKYVEIEGRGDDGNGSPANDAVYTVRDASNNTFQYMYIHDMGRTMFLGREADDWIIEYCYLARNESTASQHSEGISSYNGTDRWIIRYNKWVDIEGTGTIVFAGDGWELYGNLVYSTGIPAYGGNSNGSFCTWTGYSVSNAKVYNNTFVDITGLNAGIGFQASNEGNNNVAYNNLWYNCENIYNHGLDDVDYNWYALSAPEQDEPNVQNESSDPFTDYSNDDFTLSAETDAGLTLSSPYNEDLNGLTRGAIGVWDRGTYEYQAGGAPTNTPIPPTATFTPTPTETFTPTPTTPPMSPDDPSNILYVRAPGGSYGSEDGSDWANALDGLPTNFTRDTLYYIGDGTYTSPEFNSKTAAVSGMDKIVLRKATEGAHGTETGWETSIGDGTITLTGQVRVDVGYIEIDGVQRTDWKTGYGIYIDATAGGLKGVRCNGTGAHNCKFSYLEIEGNGPDGAAPANDGFYTTKDSDNWTVEYCYIHHIGRTFVLVRRGDSWTFDHCRFEKNEATSGQHGQGFSCGDVGVESDDFVIKHCQFVDVDGTSNVTWQGDRWKIYGCIFWVSNDGWDAVCGSAGVIGTWNWSEADPYSVNDSLVYNNTFYDLVNGPGGTGVDFNSGDTGNKAYNNIWVNCDNVNFTGVDHDYNYFYNNANTTVSETNIQNGVGSIMTDPENDDFTLSAATDAGDNTIGAEFDTDITGILRGDDGVWDRGAYEYDDAGGTTPTPTNTPGAPTATFTPTFTPTPTDTPVPSVLTLLSHWELEDDLTDSVSTNDGTMTGSESYAGGAILRAVDLNGSSYVTVTNVAALNNLSDEFSISFWFRPPATISAAEYLLYKGGLNEVGWYCRGHVDGSVMFKINDGTDSRYAGSNVATEINGNTWYHFAARVDNRNSMTLWINSQAQSSKWGDSIGSIDSIVNSADLRFGVNGVGSQLFTGRMDDIRIYSGLFTDSDVINLYNLGVQSSGRRRRIGLDGGFEDPGKGGFE